MRLESIALVLATSLCACNGLSIGAIDGDGGAHDLADARVDSSGPSPEASVDARGDSPNGLCCPIDSAPSGCMLMGGTNENDGASCVKTCDFFCSENWRIEKDSNGCDEWKYDTRQPKDGENKSCQSLDAGIVIDVGIPCGTSSCDPGTQYCEEIVPSSSGMAPTYACKTTPASCAGSLPLCQCLDKAQIDAICASQGGATACSSGDDQVTLSCMFP